MEFEGQVLLITGNTGIAAETVRRAVRLGASVFACGLEEQPGALLSIETGCAHMACDLTDPEQAERAVAHCLDRFGVIDGLFNVAGASGRKWGDGPLHLVTHEGWAKTLDFNLKTTFNVSRPVLRRMLARRSGAIVNMGSVTAFSPQPDHFATHAYAASKGAIAALTVSAASYYAPHGVRINAIAPGLVSTPMSARAQSDASILTLMKTKQPLAGGPLDPASAAEAALFLLSPRAHHITGQILAVDGGWSVSGA